LKKHNTFTAPPPYRDGGAKTATMRHQSTPQMTALKAAAATVRHHLSGTPFDKAQFAVNGTGLQKQKNRLLTACRVPRMWAVLKGKKATVSAVDELIKICER